MEHKKQGSYSWGQSKISDEILTLTPDFSAPSTPVYVFP